LQCKKTGLFALRRLAAAHPVGSCAERLLKFVPNFPAGLLRRCYNPLCSRDCKKVAGTLFDTMGVVELSYGKFGEFVVE